MPLRRKETDGQLGAALNYLAISVRLEGQYEFTYIAARPQVYSDKSPSQARVMKFVGQRQAKDLYAVVAGVCCCLAT